MDKAQADYLQYKRIRGLLTAVTEELPDAPLYYNLHDVCKTVRCQPPKFEVLRSAIIHAGFRLVGASVYQLLCWHDFAPLNRLVMPFIDAFH